MDLRPVVQAHLPRAAARVLEVGCGRGELARALADLGHDVTAIDPAAPEGPIFERVALEEYSASTRFDAVVANRALHHIHDLAPALDKIASLMLPGARLILHEHAWERLDQPTARWYLAHRPNAPSLERFLEKWSRDHAGLHGGEAIRRELDLRFARRLLAWTPYLHGELDGVDEQQEQALIDAGAIRATGFVYVGEHSD